MVKLGEKWDTYVFDNEWLKLSREDESRFFYNVDENGESKIIAYVIKVDEKENEALIATSSDWVPDLISII